MTRSFEVVSSKLIYENPWIRVIELKTDTDGRAGIYSLVERPDSAIMIVESANKKILFVKQYRYPTNSYSWELPMGGVEKDEQIHAAALRELEEEAGCSIELRKIGEFHPVPGLTSQSAHVYHGLVQDDEAAGISEYDTISDEITERRFLSYNEIMSMIESHEISDGFTLSSLSIYFWRSQR